MKKQRRRYLVAVLLLVVSVMFSGCANAVKSGTESLEEKDYKEAAKEFQKSIDKEKDLGEAYRGLGICYWEEEDYEKALEAFENALDNGAKKTATLYNFLGLCERKVGSPKKAAFYFQTGQTKDGASEELTQEMAFNEIEAYEEAKDYNSAKTKLEAYTESYPDDEKAAKELEFLETQAGE